MKKFELHTTSTPLPRGEVVQDRIGWHSEIALIRFDHPGTPVNSLDLRSLQQLSQYIDEMEENPYLNGAVFSSTSGPIFLAGADLKTLERAWVDAAQMESYLRLGQQVFERIAQLRFPTVAAIHGACLGGGCELALACDYRVASADGVTRIGLPETRLGILPAWGGTARLPRLVGLPAALKLVTQGKVLSAQQALKVGLIDQIAPRERLLEAAAGWIERGAPMLDALPAPVRRWWGKATAVTVGKRAIHELERRTECHYPAVLEAAKVMINGMSRSIPEVLADEREAVKKLSQDPRSKNLFRLFCLQEDARRLARNAARDVPEVRSVAVVGAGVMGASIAQWMSTRGIHVVLRDLDPQRLGDGMERIFRLYERARKRGVMTSREARSGIDRISPTLSARALRSVDWVIEAATEEADLKRSLFTEFDRMVGPDTLLASNTSALSVQDMAMATRRPTRVVGLHFFNPVHRMPLVEIILPEANVIGKEALALVHQMGKVPIVVRDTPGFLVNRILIPCLLEAVAAFDAGMSADEIDGAMRSFGMPMGPLELADEVGLDVTLHVAEALFRAWPDRMAVPPLLVKLVEGGLLGRKSGQGFRRYERQSKGAHWSAGHFRQRSGVEIDEAGIQERIVLRMVDEAARCLEEEVVPTAGEVDLGMVLGAGFPPFRGGPLRFADAMRAATVVERMRSRKMEPCQLLQTMAEESGRFYEREP